MNEIKKEKTKTMKLNEDNISNCFEIWDDSGNLVALIHYEGTLNGEMMTKLMEVFNCSQNSESPYLALQ